MLRHTETQVMKAYLLDPFEHRRVDVSVMSELAFGCGVKQVSSRVLVPKAVAFSSSSSSSSAALSDGVRASELFVVELASAEDVITRSDSLSLSVYSS